MRRKVFLQASKRSVVIKIRQVVPVVTRNIQSNSRRKQFAALGCSMCIMIIVGRLSGNWPQTGKMLHYQRHSRDIEQFTEKKTNK